MADSESQSIGAPYDGRRGECIEAVDTVLDATSFAIGCKSKLVSVTAAEISAFDCKSPELVQRPIQNCNRLQTIANTSFARLTNQ